MDMLLELDGDGMARLETERSLVMVMPYTDTEMAVRAAKLIVSRAACEGLLVAVKDKQKSGFISVANQIFKASGSLLFGYVAQDAFSGREWGRRVLAAFQEEKYGLLGFNDGKWAGLLASFGVARRTWALQNYAGDLFFPGYQSHYADAELTLLAIQQRAYIYDPNCVMVEVDYGKDAKDNNPVDRLVFAERRNSGFDLKVSNQNLLSLFS